MEKELLKKNIKTTGHLMMLVYRSIKEGQESANRKYYGTSEYYEKHVKYSHEYFDEFCKNIFDNVSSAASLRYFVLKELKNFPQYTNTLSVLNQIPTSFNVRGTWVSPRALVTIEY